MEALIRTQDGYCLGNQGKLSLKKNGKLNSKKENNPVLMQIKNMIRYHYTLTTKTNLKKTIPSPNKDVEQLEL